MNTCLLNVATCFPPQSDRSSSKQDAWLHQDSTVIKPELLDDATVFTASTASISLTTVSTGKTPDNTPFPSLSDIHAMVSDKQASIVNRGSMYWRTIKDNDLKLFPSHLSVEKDTIATCPFPSKKKVLPTMLNLFRLFSLMVVFTNGSTNHQPYAICEDMDGVRFHVILWRRHSPTSANDEELMVEICYISGESMLYHKRQYQHRLLQAVRENCDDYESNAHIHTSAQKPANFSYPPPTDPLLFHLKDRDEQIAAQDSLKRRSGDRTSHEEQSNVVFERIEHYVCGGDDVESIFEGLSILLNVTNANQSGFRIAETISKKLLTGTSMTSKMTLSLGLSESWYSQVELNIDDIRCDATVIRDCSLLAMRIIGQATSLLDEESMKVFVINAKSILEKDSFTTQSPLYKHIEQAEENPHHAYCAAHILARVCETVSDICLDLQQKPDIIPCIQKAVTFGSSNHVSLEMASLRLLSIVSTE